jgi:hypothetical protein
MLVFLDTAFTDFVRPNLISLALVSEDGREFYAERTDCHRDACGDFVRETVVPLLGRVPGAGWINCSLSVVAVVTRFESPATVARHASINPIGGLPVRPDRILRRIEGHVAAAHQALQFDLQAVFALGAVGAFPGLQGQVVQIARMPAQGQGNDVIELEAAFVGFEIQALLAQQAFFDAVGKARGRAHGLRVAGAADSLSQRRRGHIGVEYGAGHCLSAGSD